MQQVLAGPSRKPFPARVRNRSRVSGDRNAPVILVPVGMPDIRRVRSFGISSVSPGDASTSVSTVARRGWVRCQAGVRWHLAVTGVLRSWLYGDVPDFGAPPPAVKASQVKRPARVGRGVASSARREARTLLGQASASDLNWPRGLCCADAARWARGRSGVPNFALASAIPRVTEEIPQRDTELVDDRVVDDMVDHAVEAGT